MRERLIKLAVECGRMAVEATSKIHNLTNRKYSDEMAANLAAELFRHCLDKDIKSWEIEMPDPAPTSCGHRPAQRLPRSA